MQKLCFLTTLVILVLSIQSIGASEDEFAEFDELTPGEPIARQDPSIDASKSETASHSVTKDNQPPETDRSSSARALDEDKSSTEEDSQEQQKPDLKLVNAPLPKIYRLESYFIEAAFILVCLLYALNYMVGSNANKNLAFHWYEQSRDTLKQQFSLVGGSPQLSEGPQKKDNEELMAIVGKKQKGLIKSTDSVFYLWNSGRLGMDGLLVEICLLKRQDLFSMALNLLKVDKDTIYFRFLLNNEGYENFVFCLANKTQAPKLARDLIDINSFCPKRKPLSQYGIDIPRLVVMSELNDVATFVFDSKTASFISKYSKSINFMHITDQYSTVREEVSTAQKLANPKRMATFSFDIPAKSEDRLEILLFSLALLDRLRKFKLARDSKQKSEKYRQRITDMLQKTAFSQRQEAAQAKKEELRRLEKERIYNEDDPEKQKRWEKKEAKRELKKNKMRVKQLKVKSL